MTAMRAMNVRLCGLGYVESTGRKAGTTTSKQQSMRVAMVMGSWAMASMGVPVPDLAYSPDSSIKMKEDERLPPSFGQV